MVTLFWDEKGVILEHYTPRGTTVTRASYSDLLQNHLRLAIKSKRRGLLSTGVLLQHDNARPQHCPYNSCNNNRPAFWVSSSSTIHTRRCPKRLPYVCTTQRSNGRKEVPFWWRGTPCGAWVVARTTKRIFFLMEFMHFVSAGGLALSVGEIMLKSDTVLYHFCTINSI